MSVVMTRKKRERQSASQAPARHSGEYLFPPASSFRTPRSGDPESSFSGAPETVALVPLGEVVDINPRFGRDEPADDMLASFVPMKCVEEETGRFAPLEDRKVSDVRKGYTVFRDGDVIFAKVTPCMENGKAAVLSGLTNSVGFGSTEFFVLRPSGRIDPKYLLHFVLQQSFRKEAARNMTGAVGLRRVPKSWLEQQRIPLPPIAAQRQIVAEIEEQFTRLDAGVAALRRVQANLKRYRAAVLKAACEGRLVPTEAELAKAEGRSYETGEQLLARILSDRRKNWHGRGKYKEPAAPDTASLPRLPAGWAWATVGQLAEVVRGASPRPAGDPRYFGGSIPWITVGPLTADQSPYLRSVTANLNEAGRQSSRFIEPHTLLLTNSGATLGVPKISLIGGCINDGVAALQRVEYPLKLYLLYFLHTQTERLRGVNQGAAQPNLNTTIIKAINVPLPPLAEQVRIVAEVGRSLSMIDELETAIAANVQRATCMRQSILQHAFAKKSVKGVSLR
jgi:type I restriction enzyme S subunit